MGKMKYGLLSCWLIISPLFIFLKNLAIRKYKKLVAICESALDIIWAGGEVLVTVRKLLWKIGVMILRLIELFWDRQLVEGEVME